MASQQHDVIAQAYELARSGTFVNVTAIREQLERSGYSQVVEHFSSPTLRKQLGELIKQNRQK